jgi:phosphoglycolate phosphatase
MTRPRPTILGFDLDGTLVDTAAEIAEAANLALQDVGLAPRPVPTIERLIGAGTRELMLRLLRSAPEASGVVDADAALARFAFHYTAIAGTSCRAYEGCVAALERLRAGGVRLACLTNKEERYSRSILEAVRIAAFFDVLVGGDTLPVRKPDRRVVEHVLQRLRGSAAAMAHVGDSATDVQTARNAGVAAWVVPYGYNGGEPIESARPDRIFANLAAVADHVLEVRA